MNFLYALEKLSACLIVGHGMEGSNFYEFKFSLSDTELFEL